MLRYVGFIFFSCLAHGMNNSNDELKQKIAEAVCNYLFAGKTPAFYKHQPYLQALEKDSIKDAILKSHIQIFKTGQEAEVDYEFQRFCVTTRNPHVLMVHNLAREDVSEK